MQNKPSLDDLKKSLPNVGIMEELGEGGFKIVYRSKINDKIEALKVVHIPNDPLDKHLKEDNTRRLVREIQLLNRFETPYLVKLGSLAPMEIKIGTADYVVYSEEMLEGQSIRQRIHAKVHPDLRELATIGRCCLLAIDEMWAQNVIHRDIKPDNIIASGDDERPFVLLDLGVAFIVGGTPLTRDPRGVPGTLYYLAPEMLEQNFRESFDLRADMYALGLTLYEYAAGENPFMRREDAQYTTMHRICLEPVPPLLSKRPDLPPEFCRTIDQLLKKRPALRPNIRNVIRGMEAHL